MAELQILGSYSPGRVSAAGCTCKYREDGFDYVIAEHNGSY